MFTSAYNHDFGEIIKKSDGDKSFFFIYLKLVGIPLFDYSQKPILVADKTSTGYGKFVVVGKEVNENTYITSKVSFTEDDNGNLKLNLLDLLKLRENILILQYNQLVKMHKKGLFQDKGEALSGGHVV